MEDVIEHTTTRLFMPTAKSMKAQYTELRSIPEFEELTNTQLKYVWYYANPTSPLNDPSLGLTDLEKIESAIHESYGINVAADIKKKFLDKKWDAKIAKAISRMKKFDVNVRTKAKGIADAIFQNMEKMIKAGEDILEGDDYGKKKSYIDLVMKIKDNLPDLVKIKEQGFGLSEDNMQGNQKEGLNIMDELLTE